MRIGKIASSVEYRMDEQFHNWKFLEPNFGYPNYKNSRNLLIFQFEKFQEFPVLKIPRICNLKNKEKF